MCESCSFTPCANAPLPVTTLAGFEVVILFDGQVGIEQVFQFPELGQLLVQTVAGKGHPGE